jgi:hypothetical protein
MMQSVLNLLGTKPTDTRSSDLESARSVNLRERYAQTVFTFWTTLVHDECEDWGLKNKSPHRIRFKQKHTRQILKFLKKHFYRWLITNLNSTERVCMYRDNFPQFLIIQVSWFYCSLYCILDSHQVHGSKPCSSCWLPANNSYTLMYHCMHAVYFQWNKNM